MSRVVNGLLDRHTDGILAFRFTAVWVLLWLENTSTVYSWCSGKGLCGFSLSFSAVLFYGLAGRGSSVRLECGLHCTCLACFAGIMRGKSWSPRFLWIWCTKQYYKDRRIVSTAQTAFPTLNWWPRKIQPILIFYHQHPLSSLRFYAFDCSTFVPSLFSGDKSSQAYAQLSSQDFTRLPRSNSSVAIGQVSLNQFNASTLLKTAITDPSARMLPATAAVLFSMSTVATLLSQPMNAFSHLIKSISKIPAIPTSSFRDLCAVIQQIEVRAEQVVYLVAEIPHLRNRGESDITNYAARYTQFFNTVWLILNDVTMGMAIGSFLTENALTLGQFGSVMIRKYLVHDIIYTVRWLDSWPAGLKLNTELSWFYCHMFVGLIRFWEKGLDQITPYAVTIIYVLGCMGKFGGMTLALSATIDLIAIFTIHIYVCYFFTGLIYHQILKIAGSLFNLFRGMCADHICHHTIPWLLPRKALQCVEKSDW